MIKNDLQHKMYESIQQGDAESAADVAVALIEVNENPLEIINDVLNPALKDVGDKFDAGEFYLPELILAAEAMEAAIDVFKPYLEARREEIYSPGKVLMATVQGDIHDIGKNIVCAILRANGFTVFDIGKDVPASKIVQSAEDLEVDIIGLSALLSTTLPYCRDTINLLEEKGLRQKYIVFVGGGATTPEFAKSIGAEYGGAHAEAAVRSMLKVMGRE